LRSPFATGWNFIIVAQHLPERVSLPLPSGWHVQWLCTGL
jgi:hypothetical protein